ncbi:MAG: methyl-accepting chemotaxis protein [Lachnospiraceae bacterium]|nr:methyl-accepting chemotaxis protein [Lachnospiraceae bacterium]
MNNNELTNLRIKDKLLTSFKKINRMTIMVCCAGILGIIILEILALTEFSKLVDIIVFIIMIIIQITITFVAISTSNRLSHEIDDNLSTPLNILSDFLRRAGDTGDISHTKEEAEALEKFGKAKDEIGMIITDINHFMTHIGHIAEELESLAGGDLTTEIEVISDADTMGSSVKHLADNLNKIFKELNASSAQVSVGAKNIAEAGQYLAEGATQQAHTVKNLSESIAVIADKTKNNAGMAVKTANHADLIRDKAELGSKQMDDMINAVNDINEASQAISNVIKTISGIASQTNILSLNAAVEAARAGEHGKGFAIVADEVRNLAAQSSNAVHHTTTLIQDSIEKASLGSRIATDTAESLNEIVELIKESSSFVQEMARLSNEQSDSIININKGIDDVLEVVEGNSATSEESAASSQEMSAQATLLEEMVAEFKLRDGARHVRSRL